MAKQNGCGGASDPATAKLYLMLAQKREEMREALRDASPEKSRKIEFSIPLALEKAIKANYHSSGGAPRSFRLQRQIVELLAGIFTESLDEFASRELGSSPELAEGFKRFMLQNGMERDQGKSEDAGDANG